MDSKHIHQTIKALSAGSKGILAMDESTNTCNSRFAKLGIAQTVEARRDYRTLLVTAPGLSDYISGAILADETIRQSLDGGQLMREKLRETGIVPGIKVDKGTVDMAGFPGEKVTEGLDGLRGRLAEYAEMGAGFAKWRAVIAIGDSIPTHECIRTNMQILARYAMLCQEAEIVPIVEPEVLMDGNHTMQRCAEVTKEVLLTLYEELRMQRVDISGTLLKPNMVLPGADCPVQNSNEEIADTTIECFLDSVPASVPIITFLSGGQSSELATERLNAMHMRFDSRLPWKLTFSFSRALQDKALKTWAGKKENVEAAQKALLHRAKCNSAAVRGEYHPDMERET